MVHLAAVISFALAVIFAAWHVSHGVWTPEFLGLLGLLLWCISSSWDRTPWVRP